jgi:hypothetical protein
VPACRLTSLDQPKAESFWQQLVGSFIGPAAPTARPQFGFRMKLAPDDDSAPGVTTGKFVADHREFVGLGQR